MKVVPINIEHATEFSDVIMAIASEDIFALRPESLSSASIYRFVEQQLIREAPMYVAFENNRMLGWCEISLSAMVYSDHSGLLSMGVLPQFRGRRIGSHLIDTCMNAARDRGLSRIELTVLDNNPQAKRFYTARGFRKEGRKVQSLRINGKYHDEILMARLIPCGPSLDYDL